MQAKSMFKAGVLALAAIAVSACSSSRPASEMVVADVPRIKSGEQMLIESQNLAKFGERWKLGQQRVQMGEETVRQGRLKVEEGQRLIDEGKRIMSESEDAYQGIKK